MFVALAFAGLLIPAGLGLVLVVRVKQALANGRAQLATFAARLGLRGSTDVMFSLAGAYDGLPLYVTQEMVKLERGARAYTRVRLLTADPAAYRDPHGSTAPAFAVRRGESFSFQLATGLHEIPTGDGAFDAAYRCFVAPGTASPWSDPAFRSSLASMPRDLSRVERGPAECAATFLGTMTSPAVLERAVAMLASLASPQGAQRHHAQLAAPLDSSPSRQDVRVRWAVARLLTVFLLGALAVAPLAFLDPMNDLAAVVACDEGETLGTTGVPNGRGVRMVCIGKHGITGSADGLWFLTAVDVGWAGVLAVFSVVELGVRLARRRRA